MRLHLFKNLVILFGATVAACSPTSITEATATSQPNLTSVPILITPAGPTDTSQPLPSAAQADLDLREANVVAVEFEDLGDGRYRFDVTLLHDDDGEAPAYADWWQVNTEDGSELGRRVLTHAHSTAPFTRSHVLEIPDEITIVIIRGHDMQHGYGGQAMQVNLETGQVEAVMDTDA
jgi:hypothetical protein